MKFIKVESHLAKILSPFDKLDGEYIIAFKNTGSGVLAIKDSDRSIVDYKNMPNNFSFITIKKCVGTKYSILGFSPTFCGIIGKVRDNSLSISSIVDKVIVILREMGYEVRKDPYSSGNDLLHNNKKITGIVCGKEHGYMYFALSLQGSIDKDLIESLKYVHYPQVKLHNKDVFERIGCLPNLENRFDELCESIKNNWGYDFVEDTEIDWGIDNDLIIWGKDNVK